MSKAFKRLYKLAVSMLLVAGSIAFAPQHALAISHGPSEPGTITIDKTRDDGNEGIYEITLTIEGVPVVKPADVILVVDTSTSMSGTKMASLKAAANNFINLVLDEGAGHRIGIVSFATGVSLVSGLTDVKANLTTAINGLSASGGTFLEGGLLEAFEHLDTMSAANRNKVVVVMSDGEPTYGFDFDMGEYTGPNTGSAGLQLMGGSWYCVLPVEDAERDNPANYSGSRFDFDYTTTIGAGNSMVFTKSIFDDEETCSWLGNTYPARVFKEFSLDDSVIEIASQAPASYSIFSIGLEVNATGEAILQAIQTKGYFGASEANLEAIYAEIASSLNYAATNAVVTDVIGNHFDYVGVSAGYEGESVSYDLPSKTLTWNVGNVGTVDRVLKYKISLHEDAPGGVLPTNEWADLDYTDWEGNPQNKEFPEPEVILGYFVELEASPEMGGTVSGEGRFIAGEVVDIIATANPGFTFVGWNEFEGPGSSENSTHAFDMPEHNVKWIANFRQNANVLIQYEATLGGSVTVASESLAPVTGVAVGSAAVAAYGYNFVNWTKGGIEVSTDLIYVPPKVDGLNVAATYVANFEKDLTIIDDYVLIYVTNQPGLLIPSVIFIEGETIVAPEPELEGFVFLGWYADEGLLVEFDEFDSMPARDVIVYADWGEVLGDEDEDEDPLVPDMSDNGRLSHMGLFFFIVGLLAMISTKKEEEEA